MRIVRLTTNYSSYLDRFYRLRPSLAAASYGSQHAALMQDSFGWADFWSVALRPLGYECTELVANARPLQMAWAREHGLNVDSSSWVHGIVLAQIRALQPEILFVDDYISFDAAYLRALRKACPAIRLLLGWCGAPYGDRDAFSAYDLVLSNVPELVKEFRDRGHRSLHLNHAFAPQVLERIEEPASRMIPFSFIGSLIKGEHFHDERESLIEELLRSSPLTIYSDVSAATLRERLSVGLKQLLFDLRLRVSSDAAQTVASRRRPSLAHRVSGAVASAAKPPVYGLKMYQMVRDSEVTLNTHIGLSQRSASNMRLFEATGVGTCLLTDWKESLHSLFEPDSEVVTYRSPAECAEKAIWLLNHPAERSAIAAAGQQRVLRSHTFSHRAPELDMILRKHLHESCRNLHG